MNWFEHYGRPLCATREEAEQFMASELAGAVPEGWVVERYPDPPHLPGVQPPMSWCVRRTPFAQDYGVRVPASLDFVVFTHGNDDHGPGSLDQSLQKARVIEAWELHRYGMAACLQHVMSNCKPNQWGLT